MKIEIKIKTNEGKKLYHNFFDAPTGMPLEKLVSWIENSFTPSMNKFYSRIKRRA